MLDERNGLRHAALKVIESSRATLECAQDRDEVNVVARSVNMFVVPEGLDDLHFGHGTKPAPSKSEDTSPPLQKRTAGDSISSP